MKKIFMTSILCLGLIGQNAYSAEKCQPISDVKDFFYKNNPQSIWYVPKDKERVFMDNVLGGMAPRRYVVAGDMIIENGQYQDYICGNFIRESKVVTSGWMKRADLRKFDFVSFGAFDVAESQSDLPAANQALSELANDLPKVAMWKGKWQDSNRNRIKIKSDGTNLTLNTDGIQGAVGTGDEKEGWQPITITSGAKLEARVTPGKTDVCDIVMVGFNNAMLATSGSHCMGSGEKSSWPQFNGVYWKK